MSFPNRRYENELLSQGFRLIAGVDEVGRGAWAGPLIAGAVVLHPDKKILGVKDSKLLRSAQRQIIFELITSRALAWAIGVVTADVIDKIGLAAANRLAMERAIGQLKIKPDYLLIDALRLESTGIPSRSIIDADRLITSVAAASIVAKVTRDGLMTAFGQRYPHYDFARHKGYGTKRHHQMIRRHGLCDLHRKSFKPIEDFLDSKKK